MNDPTIRLYRGPDTLSPKKLARRLGICLRTLYRYLDRGILPRGTRQGKHVYWQPSELPADLAEYGRKLLLESHSGQWWLEKKALLSESPRHVAEAV